MLCSIMAGVVSFNTNRKNMAKEYDLYSVTKATEVIYMLLEQNDNDT